MPFKDPIKKKEYCANYYQFHKEQLSKSNRLRAIEWLKDRPHYNKDYYQANKEQIKKQNKIWRETHKKEKKELDKKYRLEHLEHCKEIDKKYGAEHKPQQKARSKKCYLKHTDRMNELNKKWKKEHPNEWREIRARNQDKRRGLGSIPLNKWFRGSHRHHYEKGHVIFIPRELHKPYHNIWTGFNMKIVNDKAFEWLNKQ